MAPGAPSGCVRKPRSSFSVIRFWAKCQKCGHEFIAYEKEACVRDKEDRCDRCGSKRYEFVRTLTPKEEEKERSKYNRFRWLLYNKEDS